MSDSTVPTPTLRATIADDRLTLTPWYPGLACAGPRGVVLRERDRGGVVIVDLTVTGDSPEDREVIVTTRQGVPMSPDARAVLTAWAQQTGHRRIWFDDAIHDLSAEPAPAGQARVRCLACSAGWAEDGHDFWLSVRANGCFPSCCPACGGQLPQWTVAGSHVPASETLSTDSQRERTAR